MLQNNIDNLIQITESVQQAAGNALWDGIKHAGKQFGRGMTDIFHYKKFNELDTLNQNRTTMLEKFAKMEQPDADLKDQLTQNELKMDDLKRQLDYPTNRDRTLAREAGRDTTRMGLIIGGAHAMNKLTSSNDKEKSK